MLKNYTVVVKNVKKSREHFILDYLNNENHKNHTKKETEIYELSNRSEFEKVNNSKIQKNEENYYNPNFGKHRGGRKLKVSNKSFTFNLPPGYKEIATIEKCKEIDQKLKAGIKFIYKSFDIEIDDNELYSVLHYQDNPHIHLLIPYLDKNGETIRQIKPKGFTSRLKLLFTKIVDEELKTNIKDYETLTDEEQKNNIARLHLEECKRWFEDLIRIENNNPKFTKYYKGQITNINRKLEANEKIEPKDLELINKNVNKAYDLRIATNRKTPKAPIF